MKRYALLLLLPLWACGNQFSTQEAYTACEGLLAVVDTADTDETFAECVACYEDCGDDCTQADAEGEATFACPTD